MLLWDTGCSDELMHPDCAQQMIARGARWRHCDPLPMQHGNAAATRSGRPATKQVAVDVFISQKGTVFGPRTSGFTFTKAPCQMPCYPTAF
jgi:hypothetical protein